MLPYFPVVYYAVVNIDVIGEAYNSRHQLPTAGFKHVSLSSHLQKKFKHKPVSFPPIYSFELLSTSYEWKFIKKLDLTKL